MSPSFLQYFPFTWFIFYCGIPMPSAPFALNYRVSGRANVNGTANTLPLPCSPTIESLALWSWLVL